MIIVNRYVFLYLPNLFVRHGQGQLRQAKRNLETRIPYGIHTSLFQPYSTLLGLLL